MEDISFLLQYIDYIVFGICLIVGYVIKHYITKIPNNAIPVIVTVLGVVISIATNLENITMSVVLSGLVSGLMSTGAHQLVKTLFKLGEDKESK